MTEKVRPEVLCVDDEPNVLTVLSRSLRRQYAVTTATSGTLGLEALRAGTGAFAVIISDMCMPRMDGATFLARSREIAPDAVRILLTGNADIDSAILAVNEGGVFRILTKPCVSGVLLATVEAAATQHRLIISERVLLEQTLHGSVQALTDMLAASSPALFGRASRLKLLASEIAAKLGVGNRWQIEMAAMLSQIACVALPAETLERVYLRQRLSDEETTMVARLPALTERLLGHIPRLESVRALLVCSGLPCPDHGAHTSPETPEFVRRGGMILRIAADFDSLGLQGMESAGSLEMLRSTPGLYDREILDALESVRGVAGPHQEVRVVALGALKVGMVIAQDLRTENGMLLVARGYEVTASFVERARNFPASLKRSVTVLDTLKTTNQSPGVQNHLDMAVVNRSDPELEAGL